MRLIEAFATPGKWKRSRSHVYECPPLVVVVALAILGTKDTKRIRALVRGAIALFFSMTGLQLNVMTPLAWEDIHAPDEAAWHREPADNSRLQVHSMNFVQHTSNDDDKTRCEFVVSGRTDKSRSSNFLRIDFQACRCCNLMTSLAPIYEGTICLVDEKNDEATALVFGADLVRIDFLTRANTLDIFTLTELLAYTTDASSSSSSCACRSLFTAADVTSSVAQFTSVAAVRLTFSTCIIDVVATLVRNPESKTRCAGLLRLSSDVFDAETRM